MICTGDQDAFLHLMTQYKKLLWVIAGGILGKVGTEEDIEECISDVFVQLWKNPKAFDLRKGTLKTYLAVITKHKALDRYRQLTRVKIVELEDVLYSTDDDLLDYVAKQDLYQELYCAIRLLNEPDKEILIRRYFFDEKTAGIAEKIAIPVKDVKNKLYQSKLKLRKILDKNGGEINGTC